MPNTYESDKEVVERFDARFRYTEDYDARFYDVSTGVPLTPDVLKTFLLSQRRRDKEAILGMIEDIQLELHNGRIENAYKLVNQLLTLLETTK